jgi:undecaprenyl-diphosphatase
LDLALILKAVILGLIEGFTEFLPISSTGHLILASELLGFNDERGKLFTIVIQSGALLALCWEYRQRILSVATNLHHDRAAQRFVLHLLIAFVPLAAVGLLFADTIKAQLFNATTVASAFIAGGAVMLWAERREHRIRVTDVEEMSTADALKIGLAQVLALIPGTSRAGATIVGGLVFGLSRRAATEFSFFLAIPTLGAATLYELLSEDDLIDGSDWGMWVAGFAAAFLGAFLSVRWLLRYITAHDFSLLAWYRIGFGALVLATGQLGWIDWRPTA